ncbi:hypothetical protein ID866_10041 [Astraeus odoratus]|nr:hypothetical protein ID866_10041 [Astraeus odoratus]
MGLLDLFGDHENSYNEYRVMSDPAIMLPLAESCILNQGVQPHEHQAKTSHELIAGAASYEVISVIAAVKAYEDHLAREGRPDDHAKAKEILYVSTCWH